MLTAFRGRTVKGMFGVSVCRCSAGDLIYIIYNGLYDMLYGFTNGTFPFAPPTNGER